MKSLKNSLMLFLTALIWGVAFVAQSVSAEYIGAFTFNGIRCFLGGLVLLPFIMFTDKKRAQTNDKTDNIDYSWKNKKLLTGGILCGIILCIASNLQQIGITYTTVGKAGFITALYVVLVPIAGIFLHKFRNTFMWCCLYTPDSRSERCKSYNGITYTMSRISDICTCRLAYTWTKTFNKRIYRLCADVYSNYIIADTC